MNKFLILFRHELKSRLPISSSRTRRRDPFGVILLSLVVILIAAVFAVLLCALVSSYVQVKINKVADPILRAKEMLNLCYLLVMTLITVAGLENMRRSLTEQAQKIYDTCSFESFK